jgi:hypothetical protein
MSPQCLVAEPQQIVRVVEKSLFDSREVSTLLREPTPEYGMRFKVATDVRKERYRSGMTRQTLGRLVETERGITLR